MALVIRQTVEHSVIKPELKYVFDVIRVIASIMVCAVIVLSAQLAVAADELIAKREPSSIQNIRVTAASSCDFNCTANTETSTELYTCERIQQRCEFNAHLPFNTQRVGRN